MGEGNYTKAKAAMGMTVMLPPNIELNLRTFVTLVNQLVTILNSSKTGLDDLQGLIANGTVAPAQDKARQLEGLLADASGRIDLLYASLDRVSTIYGINVEPMRQELRVLATTVKEYQSRLADLKVLLQETDLRTETSLSLSVTPDPVWVEKNVTITGQLTSLGVGLAQKVVDVWVAAPAYSRFRVTADKNGAFELTYHVSSDPQLSFLKVFASYVPAGNDTSTLRPATSQVMVVTINYYPAILTITTSSDNVHVLQEFTAQGTLADSSGHPMASESVQLMIDNSSVTAQTNQDGTYQANLSFPAGASEGPHDLYARFNSTSGVYASASSEKIPLQLYYLTPSISPAVGELLAFSGQVLHMNGRLELGSDALSQGSVVAYLEGRELGRAVSDANGFFSMTFIVPLDVTGDNTLRLVYVPKAPWFASTTSSVLLRVLDTAMTVLCVGVVACIGLIVVGNPFRPRSQLELPRAPQITQEPKTLVEEETEARTIATPQLTPLRAADLSKFDDPRVCIRETYWATRQVLAEILHEPGRLSETHREYFARVAKTMQTEASTAFSSLTRLFELAEYSQHPLSRTEAAEAIDDGMLVSESIGVKTMP
jgi:hypothetical protein